MALKNVAYQDSFFVGGLDGDSDVKSIAPGDYLYASGMCNKYTESGVDGSMENTLGNRLVPYTLPTGINKCIGKYEDVPNRTVFYFIWNENGDHSILRWYPTDTLNPVQVILSGPILNFQEWDYINHVNLVGDLLYWTDGVNPQRKINVKRANNTNKRAEFKICFDDKGTVNTVVSFLFSANIGSVSIPSISMPFGSRSAMALVAYNAFIANTTLVSYFTIENKGEYLYFTAKPINTSVLWTYSYTVVGALPFQSWLTAVNFYSSITTRHLDVCAWPNWMPPYCDLRNNPAKDKNLLDGNVYQFRVSIIQTDGEESVLSHDSKWVMGLTNPTVLQKFDYPIYYGNNNEVRVVYNDNRRIASYRDIIKNIIIYYRTSSVQTYQQIAILQDFELDGQFFFDNQISGFTISDTQNQNQYQSLPYISKCQEVVNNKLFFINNKLSNPSVSINASVTKLWEIKKVWDTGYYPEPFGVHSFGIVYFDRMNRCQFVLSSESIQNIPSSYTGFGGGKEYYCKWEISNLPPVWATHYAWFRTDDVFASDYYKADVVSVVYYDNLGLPVSFGPNVFYAEVIIGDTFPYQFDTVQNEVNFAYFNDASGFDSGSLGNKVISYDGATKKVTVEYNTTLNPSLIAIDISKPIELARLKPILANQAYYGFNEFYEIGNSGQSNRYHKAGFQGVDQVPGTTPATGYFYGQWQYFNPLSSISVGFSTRWPIAASTNKIVDPNGRPNFFVPYTEKVIKESIVFSNVKNNDTEYNGFGTFLPTSNGSLPIGFGGINKAQNIDNILLCIMDNKCFSVYIDKGILQGQDGSQTISVSGQVIGAYRDLKGIHGTINPESFAMMDGLAFWWDAYRGQVCQYGSDGITPVSRYKMNTPFAVKGKQAMQVFGPEYKVKGVIHKRFSEYIIAFPAYTIDSEEICAETLVFNFDDNRWKQYAPFVPEMMTGFGTGLVSFKNGQLWVHDNAIRNNFYGVQYPSKLKWVINAAEKTDKNMSSISIESNQAPNIPVITTPPSDLNLNGQLSELLSTDFEFINNSYWSSFLCNKLTPNIQNQVIALNNGDPMTGSVMILELSNNTAQPLIIRSSRVYFNENNLTN